MSKKKVPLSKQKSRPRCVCGAYADLVYMPGQRHLGKPVFVDQACRKCTRLAMDATMVAGGCLKFIDDMEVEWQAYEVDEAEAAAAIFTERCRRIDVDGEIYLMAIFKLEYEHGWEWYAQPIPFEAED
jgi:hypothetical protein